MKKIVILACMCLLAEALLADRVILRDSTTVNGKIIQVTGKGVEIDPDGDVPFDLITRDRIAKIVYDDGKEIQIAFDKLYMHDGKVIEAKIKQVNPAEVVYTPKGSTANVTVPRDQVQTIQFMDGREINMEKDAGDVEIADTGERVKGFHGSFLRIAALVGFGGMTGQLINRDENLFDSNAAFLNTYHGIRDWETRNSFVNVGGEIDLMLPAFEFAQTGSFSFTGIKLGARGRYMYFNAYSGIYDDDNDSMDEDDEFGGTLMRYHSWAAGPVLWFIFSPRSNNFNLLLNVYAVAGQVFSGEMWGAPALRDAGVAYGRDQYHTRFSGYTLRVGLGPHFALNRWFPVTVGFNIFYAFTRIELDDPVSVYGPAKTKYNNDEWGCEISLGVHL